MDVTWKSVPETGLHKLVYINRATIHTHQLGKLLSRFFHTGGKLPPVAYLYSKGRFKMIISGKKRRKPHIIHSYGV